ncbi:MAG TPA: hypothetical protein VFL65_00690 [Jatrophihabitans sp.]|nr:hypothetical protein [Jatrophihabitans sp.]
MSTDTRATPRARFNRRGEPILAPYSTRRQSSPARERFHAERVARRELARTAAQRAMQAVHAAAAKS